jgi:hypothetical protein
MRTRARGLEDNFRYWLLYYRAVCESFSVVSGSLSLEVLLKEVDTAQAALRRLEPEYGKFLANVGVTQPGRLAFLWPRTSTPGWKRENSFV